MIHSHIDTYVLYRAAAGPGGPSSILPKKGWYPLTHMSSIFFHTHSKNTGPGFMETQSIIRIATSDDLIHASTISEWYVISSQERGIGIARRTPEYLAKKIQNGNAIIAFVEDHLAGFCYVEVFSSGTYVSNSGLIVKREFRGLRLASRLKATAFSHARNTNPDAKVFGITTSDVVMGLNSKLGYRPVSYSQLTSDEEFWKGCSSCRNYDILMRNNKTMCLCTAMLAPSKVEQMKHDLGDMIIQPKPLSK